MSLKLSKISKRYNDKWVLRDASLEVEAGEIFGLLGASGTGKTTLLQIVSGEKPSSGQIFYNDKDVTEISEKERSVFYPRRESDNFWNSIFKSNRADNASAGEKQENLIEKTFETDKEILLLDNPFCCLNETALDDALANLRQKAKEKNLAVILVTSDYRQAFKICDRIGVLHRGEIAQTGTPREVYEKPASVSVAHALGRNNFIRARRITFNNEYIQEFQTLTGGHRLVIGKTDKRSLGTITNEVTLSIRPEHISLSFGASFPEDNLLKAEIIEVQYLGATTRVKLSAGGLHLEALVLRLVGLNVGDECMVGLPPDRIIVLKD